MNITQPISNEEIDAFTIAVKARFGMDFTNYEPKSLQRGLKRLMTKQKKKSLFDLWAAMLYDRSLIVHYVDELLINLTEFFRNPDLWQLLHQELLPSFSKYKSWRIWHAGCSTGEEAYSMAVTLAETGYLEQSTLLATDLSTKALTQAVAGQYHEFQWSACQRSYAQCHFRAKADAYLYKDEKYFYIASRLKQSIQFQRHDLVQESVKGTYDLIFCRNVMIYFDDRLKEQVLKRLYQALSNDGYLIIGYYDMLPDAARKWFQLHCAKQKIYKKIQNATF